MSIGHIQEAIQEAEAGAEEGIGIVLAAGESLIPSRYLLTPAPGYILPEYEAKMYLE